MDKLQSAYQEESQHIREENHIIRNNLPRLTNIIQGHNPSMILTGNTGQELQSLLQIIERQREMIGALEGQLENSQNGYESLLEQSLQLARRAAREPLHRTSYLQETVEREEAKVRELEDLLKEKTSQTARQISQLKYTEIEQTAEMSVRSTPMSSMRSPVPSKMGNRQDENRRSRYLNPLG